MTWLLDRSYVSNLLIVALIIVAIASAALDAFDPVRSKSPPQIYVCVLSNHASKVVCRRG